VRADWETAQGDNQTALRDLNRCIERNPGAQVMIPAFSQRERVKQALGDSVGANADRQEVQILQQREQDRP
jgi:hypothetical protein